MKLFASLFASLGSSATTTIVAGLLAISIFSAGYIKGSASEQIKQGNAQLTIALAYAGEIIARQEVADGLAADNATLRAIQAPKDRIITKEITRYVEVTPPALRCILPGTWRLRHDAAATGEPTSAEAGSLATGGADPIEDATALEIIGDNYQACRNAIAQVEGWQRRYLAIEAKR